MIRARSTECRSIGKIPLRVNGNVAQPFTLWYLLFNASVEFKEGMNLMIGPFPAGQS